MAGRRLRVERSNQYRIKNYLRNNLGQVVHTCVSLSPSGIVRFAAVKNYLLRNYDKTTRPVINDSAPVNVVISLSLYHILDTVSHLPTGA